MDWIIYGVVAVALGGVWWWAGGRTRMPELGEPAPDFEAVDQQGQSHRLSAYRGQWVVLYFYPKDDTPGCTKEACGFRDLDAKFSARRIKVLGVSVDTPEAHASFAQKFNLPFTLLADPEGHVATRFGVLFRIGPVRVARRRTFVIDPDGGVAAVYSRVSPARHAAEILDAIGSRNP